MGTVMINIFTSRPQTVYLLHQIQPQDYLTIYSADCTETKLISESIVLISSWIKAIILTRSASSAQMNHREFVYVIVYPLL